ncbi:acid protease [Plenodomus tracheiphilus IPT5]|uniref:Acid protease n=1 Tax=Plenodomus tracheiphilus IPT5 TaxID=1408161 RepID=A0A6A7BGH8_9PLEO|nr:acid protease [Plenodomus tracheiphilus IPT5]
MLSLAQITAIIAFSSAVIAAPVAEHTTFSMEQLPRSKHIKNGPQQMIQYMRTYGLDVSPELSAAAEKQASKAAPLTARGIKGSVRTFAVDEYTSEYVSPLVIGGKTIHVSLGTAASDVWVFSSLQSKAQRKGHDYYEVNPANIKKGYSFNIGYSGNLTTAKGKVYTEKIKLGSITTTQVIGAAETVNDQMLDDQDSDGMFGLGFSYTNGITPKPQLSFFDTIKPQLEKPLFSVALKHNTTGSFDFGFIDGKKMNGPITYADVVDDGWGAWSIIGEGFSVGSNPKITARKMKIHFDAATSISYTDPDIVSAAYSKIPGAKFDKEQQAYTLPCNAKSVPDITFSIRGSRQVISGERLKYAPIDDDGRVCYGALQNIGGGVDFSLLGINFFVNKYLVHDTNNGKPRLGFARQSGEDCK